MHKSLLVLILVFISLKSFSQLELNDKGLIPQKPKNIILMIGDGMGITQITAGLYMNNNELNLEKFPVIGLHKSYSANDLITDSAAGATAFSCGVKTKNHAVGVDEFDAPVKTILDEAKALGMSTGIVTSSTLVHGTPASFYAHQKHREMYEPIAIDFVRADIDFAIGGGKKYFDRRTSDELNLYQELESKDYYVSDYFKEELVECKIPKSKNFVYFTNDNDPLPAASGRKYLKLASRMAMAFLSNHDNKGFFLVIEGAQIDWGGHTNDSDYIVNEVLDFDRTIGEVLRFAARDKETLVIVTGDHETGGYSILHGSTMGNLKTAFTTDYHTATLIPVFAFGPGARLFSGIYENIDINKKMKKAMGL